MNEHRNCTCPASKSGSFQIATDHYSRNFIPTGWKLEYTSLEQHEPQRFLYMTGWCLRCGGQDLQSGISIPDELSGDALLERIYREMEHYRPFEHRRSDGTYNRSLLRHCFTDGERAVRRQSCEPIRTAGRRSHPDLEQRG